MIERVGKGAVLAAAVAVMTGFLGAALGNRIGWEAVPAFPAGAERDQLAELFTPGMAADWYESTSTFENNGGETDAASLQYDTGRTPATEDVDGYLAGLEQRLDAAGWRVLDSWPTSPTDIATGVPQNNSQALIARNDTLVLSFEDYFDAAYDEGGLSVVLHRAEPRWLTVTTLLAGLLGALAGWVLTGWASRGLRGRAGMSYAAGVAAVIGILTLAPAWLFSSLSFLSTLTGRGAQDMPFWRALVPTDEFGGLAVPALTVLVVALLIAVAGRILPLRSAGVADDQPHR
ncbi:hypothetical protein OHA21_20410 [Actinoplanes sp. NBC_00393]|uniref:hypothetical protein n=1 Tax=Actinoplanes sp. NBC_00393 TaxID=2975953 RepID=UPI002E1B5906